MSVSIPPKSYVDLTEEEEGSERVVRYRAKGWLIRMRVDSQPAPEPEVVTATDEEPVAEVAQAEEKQEVKESTPEPAQETQAEAEAEAQSDSASDESTTRRSRRRGRRSSS